MHKTIKWKWNYEYRRDEILSKVRFFFLALSPMLFYEKKEKVNNQEKC